jgi:NADPH:quinone reductase-like Zn-dependent oxidoreductase
MRRIIVRQRMGIIPKTGIFGADISGTVLSAGKEVSLFKPGEEVMGDLAGCGFGGLAEYAVAPERVLVSKPGELSFEDAAALPMAAVTALQALRDKGKIHPEHHVLIIGSSGGVGTYAVQLAKHFGATVTAVCSTQNQESAMSLGADHVFDYKREDFFRSGRRFDLIVAINGNYSLSACMRILNTGGVYVMAGGALVQIFKSILFGWLLSAGSKKVRFLAARPDRKDLEIIAGLARDKKIKPVIDKRFPLEKTPEAMKYISQGHARGKVVINVL